MTAPDETGSRDGYLFLNLLSASATRSCLGVDPSPGEPGEGGTPGELRPTAQLTAPLVFQNRGSRAGYCLVPLSSRVYRPVLLHQGAIYKRADRLHTTLDAQSRGSS